MLFRDRGGRPSSVAGMFASDDPFQIPFQSFATKTGLRQDLVDAQGMACTEPLIIRCWESGGPVSRRAGYVFIVQIGSRPRYLFVDVVAIPARQETGPPGVTVTYIIRHASRPGDRSRSPECLRCSMLFKSHPCLCHVLPNLSCAKISMTGCTGSPVPNP